MKKKIIGLYKQNKEAINYILVGGMTTVVSLGVYYGLVWTVLNPKIPMQLQLANIISWVAAVTFAYFTNRKYVFESKNQNIIREFIEFYLSRAGSLLLDMLIMYVGVTILGGNDKYVKILVQVVVTIVNYIISKFFVFKEKG